MSVFHPVLPSSTTVLTQSIHDSMLRSTHHFAAIAERCPVVMHNDAETNFFRPRSPTAPHSTDRRGRHRPLWLASAALPCRGDLGDGAPAHLDDRGRLTDPIGAGGSAPLPPGVTAAVAKRRSLRSASCSSSNRTSSRRLQPAGFRPRCVALLRETRVLCRSLLVT